MRGSGPQVRIGPGRISAPGLRDYPECGFNCYFLWPINAGPGYAIITGLAPGARRLKNAPFAPGAILHAH